VCDLPEALHLALAVVSALPGGGRCSVTRRCFCRKLPGPTRPDEEVWTPRNGQSGGTAYRIYPRSKRSIPSQRGGSREGRDIDVGSFLSDGHELIRGQF
jgi:hypothetical protein